MDKFSATGIRSSIPQVNRYPEGPGPRALFHSIREIALIMDKTVRGGFGYLKAGMVMAVEPGGDLVPYVPISTGVTLGDISAIGAAPLVKDATAGHVFVSIADSYKFKVGDHLYLDNGSDEGPVLAEDITAIDRTTSTLYADITTTTFSHGDFTVTKGSYARLKTGTTGEYTMPAYILDKDIDTGEGPNALGALTSVVVSNCILYKNAIHNLTAEAITALGYVDGRFFIMK